MIKTPNCLLLTRDVRDRTKKIILHRDRDRDQRLNPRLYDGLNFVIFCTSEVTLFEKKEPKSASRRLNKLKKRVLKNFLDEVLNYRSAGPGPGPGPKEKFQQGQNRDRKKNYRNRDRDQIKRVTGTKKSWCRTYLFLT